MDAEAPRPTFMTAELIRVSQAGFRPRREAFDRHGALLGTFKYGEFRDSSGRHVVRAVRASGGWRVLDYSSNPIGMILPASRTDRKGRVKPVQTGEPLEWTGWICLDGSEEYVACIKHGQVIAAPGGVLAADVLIGEKPWWGSVSMRADWRIRFPPGGPPDRRLRLMCFGWLAVAWIMQRNIETSA